MWKGGSAEERDSPEGDADGEELGDGHSLNKPAHQGLVDHAGEVEDGRQPGVLLALETGVGDDAHDGGEGERSPKKVKLFRSEIERGQRREQRLDELVERLEEVCACNL